MTIAYRLFNHSIEDAAGVLEVEAACWDESPHSPQTLLELLNSTEQVQACWLAEDAGQVVGFMHAFLTHGQHSGTWELDLLAVHPDWRRRGIATKLVRCALGSAPSQAVVGRALIAPHNSPSVKAFERAGFRSEGTPQAIYEYDISRDEGAISGWPTSVAIESLGQQAWRASVGEDALILNEVHTILYDGLWVESVRSRIPGMLLQATRAHARRRGLDIVGWVVSLLDVERVALAADEGFKSLGDSHTVTVCRLFHESKHGSHPAT